MILVLETASAWFLLKADKIKKTDVNAMRLIAIFFIYFFRVFVAKIICVFD